MYTTSLFWDSGVRLGVGVAIHLAGAEYRISPDLCQIPFFNGSALNFDRGARLCYLLSVVQKSCPAPALVMLARVFLGREDSSNGQVSEVWKGATVRQQSPVVEEGDAPQLECEHPESDVDGERQACLQASLHGVHQDSR